MRSALRQAIIIGSSSPVFYDDMLRPASFLETNPAWVPDAGGTAGAIQYTSAAIKLNTSVLNGYIGVQKGNTRYQEIQFTARITSTTAGAVCVNYIDKNNWIGFRWTTTQLTLLRSVAGSVTAPAAWNTATTIVVGDVFRARIVPIAGVDTVQTWQNGVQLAVASGSVDVTSIIPTARRPGLVTRTDVNSAWIRGWSHKAAI